MKLLRTVIKIFLIFLTTDNRLCGKSLYKFQCLKLQPVYDLQEFVYLLIRKRAVLRVLPASGEICRPRLFVLYQKLPVFQRKSNK